MDGSGGREWTAGPWAVNPLDARVDAFSTGGALPVCRMLWPTKERTEAETEANARMLQVEGAAELLRLCTSTDAPRGSGSKLYSRAKRIWQLMGGTKLHTYTLTKESGASLRGAGLTTPAASIDGAQWDRSKRPRTVKAIHDQPKVRWTEELSMVPA